MKCQLALKGYFTLPEKKIIIQIVLDTEVIIIQSLRPASPRDMYRPGKQKSMYVLDPFSPPQHQKQMLSAAVLPFLSPYHN